MVTLPLLLLNRTKHLPPVAVVAVVALATTER